MTDFYLATKAKEFKRCHEILDLQGRRASFPLSFPTIIGLRNDRIIAFVSTRPVKQQKAVVLGEMAVDPSIQRPLFVTLELLEIYDAFLYRAGIKSYLACIRNDQVEFLDTIERISGVVPYTKDSEYSWINRRIV